MSKRTKALGLAATLAALPLLLPTSAGATAGPGYTDSSNDPNSYPPLPSECAGYQWWQWTGDPNAQVLSKSNPFIVLPDSAIGAGHVTITEAITWDARPVKQDQGPELTTQAAEDEEAELTEQSHRKPPAPAPEVYEKMRVEFYKDGELVGSSPFHTPDLPDDAAYAWSVSWLGELDLYEGADKIVLKHASGFMPTDGAQNAFLPKAVCVEWTPFETPTTQPPTTEPPTTLPPATVPPTVPPQTEVLDEAVEVEQLAFTGNDSAATVGLGAALLATGAALLGVSRRRNQSA